MLEVSLSTLHFWYGSLRHEVMALPVIELTDGGAPATGKDVLHEVTLLVEQYSQN